MKKMSVNFEIFANGEHEIKELEKMANDTIDSLYHRGYVISSDVFIRLLDKIDNNPLMIRLL